MKIFEYIYYQVDRFNKSGKNLVPPKNKAEKSFSRVLALILLFLAILFYLSLLNTAYSVPLRIHIRAWIYLVPWLVMVYKLYKGISISWLINGILKYWMLPLMLVWVYLVIMNMLYVIFFGGDYHHMLVTASFMMFYSGFIYFVYFLRKSKSSATYFPMVLFTCTMMFFAVVIFLWGTGTLDWFHDEVLGW